jgi:GNAT superfamily N-acetyltransferase
MTERTICLDPDPRDWRSRKIQVRAYRWYATVSVDRDGYVSASAARGHDHTLPAAYTEAVDKARHACMDRISYDGYPGRFHWGDGPSWTTLFAPFPHVDATVEALRAAELDHDYSQLHALADRLALPVHDWLAPGERELVRGIDFVSPPAAFLRFLRDKAEEHGVRLNGRATAGSVWVRPTLSPAEKQLREGNPEQYPGWADRWTGYTEPEDAPLRPSAGGRDQNLSRGAVPVRFRAVDTPSGGDCPCGMGLRDLGEGGKAHARHHVAWALGMRAPKNLEWWGSLAVVTTQSPLAWRKLVYQVARIPQKENHYDFNSWSHLDEPEVTADNVRAYLLKANERVIGYLAAHDHSRHARWDLVRGSRPGDQDETRRPRIDLIWVADAYRRRGVGAGLVRALADDSGCRVADVSWSTPISDAGQRLARRLSPDGVWVS